MSDNSATAKTRNNTRCVNVRMDKLTNGLMIQSLANSATIETEILTKRVVCGGKPSFKNRYEIGSIESNNPPITDW